MADAADFTLRLVDEATGPAKRAAAAFDDMGQAMKHAGVSGNSGMTGAIVKGNLLADAIQTVGQVALSAAVALVKMGAQAAMAFTSAVVEGAAFIEKTELAFKMLMGGSKGASAQIQRVIDIATKLGLPVEDSVKSFQKLLAMQFKPAQAEDMIKMSSDLAAIGADAEQVKRAITAITQIKAKGRLQSEELVGQLAEAGVSTDLVLKQLSKSLGVTSDEVRKLLESGKITADQGIAAIGEAIKIKTGAKNFGDAGAAFATTTLTGMVNVMKSKGAAAMLELGKKILTPLTEAVKPIAKDLMAAMDSPEAKAALDAIAASFAWVFGAVKQAWPAVKEFLLGLVEGLAPLKDVAKGFMSAMGPVLEIFGVDAKDAASSARVLGQAIAVLIGATTMVAALSAGVIAIFAAIPVVWFKAGAAIGEFVVGAVAWFSTLPGRIAAFVGMLRDGALQLGTAIIDGIVGGITSGVARVSDAVRGAAQTAISTAKSTLGIASPSTVFAELGAFTAQGFAGGMESGSGEVRSASSQMTGAALSGVGAGSTGGAPSFGNLTVQVTVEGGSSSSAEELGTEFGSRLRRELAALFDGMEPA